MYWRHDASTSACPDTGSGTSSYTTAGTGSRASTDRWTIGNPTYPGGA